ncbi:MAG: GNAT family N-acetyltransferase [Candidatus Dormibacteria bacterium]
MVERATSTSYPGLLDSLAQLLVDTVATGGSVGFRHPLDPAEARAYWEGLAADIAADRVILLTLHADAGIVGTVHLRSSIYPNGRHRAEVAKLMVHSTQRRRGFGRLLMLAAENHAMSAGKSLLYLDTETDSDAGHLYRRLGWEVAGDIPDFACTPHGELRSTTFLYRRLAPGSAAHGEGLGQVAGDLRAVAGDQQPSGQDHQRPGDLSSGTTHGAKKEITPAETASSRSPDISCRR